MRAPTITLLGIFLISCPKSSPPPADPIPEEPAAPETPKTAQEKADAIAPGGKNIEFTTEDQVVIRGTQWDGQGEDGRAVILVHQLGSDRFEWKGLIQKLVPESTVLAIDMRGHGESTSRADGSEIAHGDFDEAAWAQLPLDVQAAVEHLMTAETPPQTIALAGSSIGSSAVLLYSVFDTEIERVALLSPGLAYQGLNTVTALEEYGKRPILLVASTGDEQSAEAVAELGKTYKKATTRVIDGSAHGVKMAGESEPLWADVASFLGGAELE